VLDLKELNDVEIFISEFDPKNSLTEAKQFFLNEFEIAFAKHLLKFRKAFATGKDFAKKVTSET